MSYINVACVVTPCVIIIIIIIQLIYYIVVEALVHVSIEMLIVIIFNITPCKAPLQTKVEEMVHILCKYNDMCIHKLVKSYFCNSSILQ
jgi:hypothetical protein